VRCIETSGVTKYQALVTTTKISTRDSLVAKLKYSYMMILSQASGCYGYMVPRLELQQHNCSLCLTHRHMEDESTRTPAGNLPRTFADHSPWHDKASSARLAPSKLCTTDTTRNEFCTAADKLGVGMRNRDEPDNRDDQAHPEKSLRSAADAMQAWHNRSQLKMRRARQRDELDVAE